MAVLTKWLNKMVRLTIVLLLFTYSQVFAQPLKELTLQQAYDFARANYPLLQQKDLINKSAFLTIENISTAFLPQVTVSGQATYQSEVTKIPISLPGFSIDPLSRDQYKLMADINQLLYDGGVTKTQKDIQQVNKLVEQQKTEVELYKLKDRINQLFLGVLLLEEQKKQTLLQRNDVQLGLNKVTAQVANGTAFKTNKLVLEAELLKNDARQIELDANRKALLDVLQYFTNKNFWGDIHLILPTLGTAYTDSVERPELQLYALQDSLLTVQNKLISARNKPKTSAFVQGGYGRPGLNQLMNDFNFYYIGGIKLSWSLGSLYTTKRDRQINAVSHQTVAVQKDLFTLNTDTQLAQQGNEIEKLEQLITVDNKIIAVREAVMQASNAQLENGVITANDYLREVNAADQARQNLVTHQLQLTQAKLGYLNILGKL